jgi:hypothetical protein
VTVWSNFASTVLVWHGRFSAESSEKSRFSFYISGARSQNEMIISISLASDSAEVLSSAGLASRRDVLTSRLEANPYLRMPRNVKPVGSLSGLENKDPSNLSTSCRANRQTKSMPS